MRHRRLTPTHQITIAATVLWLLAIAGISQANAAQLTVNTGANAAVLGDAPCANGLTVVPAGQRGNGNSPNYEQVEISNMSSDCDTRPLAFYLLDGNGDVLMSGIGTAQTGTAIYDTSGNQYKATDVDGALVFIDSWPISATWSMDAPPPPPSGPSCVGIDLATPGQTYPCTLTIDSTATWTTNGYRYTQVNFDAVTNAPLWEVTFDLSSTTDGFTGMSPVRFLGTYQNVAAAPGYACSSLPSFVGREANPSWGSTNGEIVFTDDPGYTAGTTICDV